MAGRSSEVRIVAQHIAELRLRVMVVVAVLLAGGAVGYLLRAPVYGWIEAPLHDTLYYTSPLGGFNLIMQICLLVGAVVAVPVLVCQLLFFINPAMPRPISRKRIIGLTFISYLMCLAGVLFAYYLSLPTVLHFLRDTGLSGVKAMIGAKEYMSFVISYLLIFAAVFQLPLIFLGIDSMYTLKPKMLWRWQKWVILGALVFGIVLPLAPDPVSQLMLAVPVIVLYDLSIGLIAWRHAAQRSRAKRRGRSEVLEAAPAVVPEVVITEPIKAIRRVPNRRSFDLRPPDSRRQ